MPETPFIENDFIRKVTEIIEENLSNERFGVSELAREMGMSRSNLLRKVNQKSRLSASQFIRQVRLKKGMEMLKQTSFTVSEVSYRVGFGSPSYFIKCFRDYYGYPPGKVGQRDTGEGEPIHTDQSGEKRRIAVIVAALFVAALVITLFIVFKPFSSGQEDREKSIAVLPFKNDSNDSTNLYLINGLMESILNNLQKIEDLRVISRTSVEKYRSNPKTIPEIARELDANYFVEGSGQKIGDRILLNIQLIEAPGDKHLWSEQYNREAKDIFDLQAEVSKIIVDKIEAIITPEEEEWINKIPTEDMIAYDYFLKGLDLLNRSRREYLEEAISFFGKAIELDDEFARAHAAIAIAYYFLDLNQAEKKYSVIINHYADKALLLDSHLPTGLVAKALFYLNNREYERAVPYFEKALEYNPNYDLAIGFLADLYVNYIPDTEKYLEYALRGIELELAANDSSTASIRYLHLSNAFIQSGFIDEAEFYINRSLEYNPGNLYSEYVRAYILFARNGDLQKLKERLIEALHKDTTRYDILMEAGKVCYFMRDFTGAYHYFNRFIDIKEALKLDVYRGENAKIGFVLCEMGLEEESEKYFADYLDYAENDKTIYKHLSLAAYNSFKGNREEAIEQMELFSEQTNYNYWILLFLEIDPLVDNIRDLPQFKKILRDIENKFWKYHKQIKTSLEVKGLM